MLLHLNAAVHNREVSAFRDDDKGSEAIHIYGPEGLYNFVAASLKMSRAVLYADIVVHELVMPDSPEVLGQQPVFMGTKQRGKPQSPKQRAAAPPPPLADPQTLRRDKPDSFKLAREREHKAAAVPVEQFSFKKGRLTRVGLESEEACGLWNLPSLPKSHGGEISVKCVHVHHTVPTVGFVFQEGDLPGKLDAAKATALGLPPGPIYQKLKAGEDVPLEDGSVVKAADVMAAPTKGRKLALLGDCYDPGEDMAAAAAGCDLLVHEATVEVQTDMPRALASRHSTAAMAGAFAKRIDARRLVLTHFSQRTDRGRFNPTQYVLDWSSGAAAAGKGGGSSKAADVSKEEDESAVASDPECPKPQWHLVDSATGDLKKVTRYNQNYSFGTHGAALTPASLGMVSGAARAFGKGKRHAVSAAEDFMTVLVPRGGFER